MLSERYHLGMYENAEAFASTSSSEDNEGRFRLFSRFFKTRIDRITRAIKSRKKLSAIIAILLLTALVLFIAMFVIAFQGLQFYSASKLLANKVLNRDFSNIESDIDLVKDEYEELKNSYKFILPLKAVPLLGYYVKDGEYIINSAGYGVEATEILVKAIEPYADIFGFEGARSSTDKLSREPSAERINFLVSSLPHLVPEIESVSEKLKLVKSEVVQINPSRYPGYVFGRDIRGTIEDSIESVVALDDIVRRGKSLLSVAPYLLGTDEKREYLILFQNDKELRPTGGFMTAYTVADVEKGVFRPVSSSDIYSLDASYTPSVPASRPMVDYIQGPYVIDKNFRIRDINWSPDFRESIELFLKEASSAGLPTVDGVIAVDTQLLVNILDAMGPIQVPEFGEFSTEFYPECNCPQVIYELERFSDVEGPIVWDPLDPTKIIYAPENFDNRKKILGPLMNALIVKALAQPKEKLPGLFNAIYNSFIEKHILIYVSDETTQKAIEEFGISGTLQDYDGDYLHINDANLGGRKSNLYVTQTVNHEITVAKDGSIEKTLEITYKNPQPYDGWLNSVLPNWTRIYLPLGSDVVEISGFEDPGEVSEELGKTVVSGGFKLRPQGVSIITVVYKLPFKVDKDYNLFIQKQPGKDAPIHTIKLNENVEEFYLRRDLVKSLKIK